MKPKWRILAWDDDPSELLESLKPKLERSGRVELLITKELDECFHEFHNNGPWDLLILDVIDKMSDPEEPDRTAGIRLASQLRAYSDDIPIVFLTHDDDIILHGDIF